MTEVKEILTMPTKRFRWLFAVLAMVLCSGAFALDSNLPNFVSDMIKTNAVGSDAKSLMVSIQEFKEFRPSIEFTFKESALPMSMTEREATDYARFRGKTIGKDFCWKSLPPDQQKKESVERMGYLFYAAGLPESELVASKPVVLEPPTGMVYAPEGPFTMGSDMGDGDETPEHKDYTGPFFIDVMEIGNADFKQVFPDFSFEPGKENSPAVVTWEQANAYAEKVGKRLPTEAEWEKAARGNDKRVFPWGDSFDPSYVIRDKSAPRGSATACPPSPYGCVDMAGGVWEWTADWYKAYPASNFPSDNYGELYKTIRGGGTSNDIAMFRASQRHYLEPTKTGGRFPTGFRCVQDLTPEQH
jgi:formylglycine-generating enzyme required for sulfatase activity